MAENRNPAVIHDVSDKAVAPAWDDQVDQRIFLQHLSDIFTRFEKLGGICRKRRFGKRAANEFRQNLISAEGFAAAFQENGIPAFYTERGDLDERIRTAFKDHTDHADRGGNLI